MISVVTHVPVVLMSHLHRNECNEIRASLLTAAMDRYSEVKLAVLRLQIKVSVNDEPNKITYCC